MNASRNRLVSFALVFTFLIVAFQTLSISQTRAGQPGNFYEQLAPGLLTRTLFTASSGTDFSIEVRELLFGPGQRTSQVSLPGAAVFEVRSGEGIVTVSEQPQKIQPGSTFALSEGETFQIENEANTPITMRVHLFMAETPIPEGGT
ncbi:MAG: hypothetical protein MN733_01245 [Nitrososphaera sp.]|nr:hypothetical protein [Nitrososphaera sp.]